MDKVKEAKIICGDSSSIDHDIEREIKNGWIPKSMSMAFPPQGGRIAFCVLVVKKEERHSE